MGGGSSTIAPINHCIKQPLHQSTNATECLHERYPISLEHHLSFSLFFDKYVRHVKVSFVGGLGYYYTNNGVDLSIIVMIIPPNIVGAPLRRSKIACIVQALGFRTEVRSFLGGSVVRSTTESVPKLTKLFRKALHQIFPKKQPVRHNWQRSPVWEK